MIRPGSNNKLLGLFEDVKRKKRDGIFQNAIEFFADMLYTRDYEVLC